MQQRTYTVQACEEKTFNIFKVDRKGERIVVERALPEGGGALNITQENRPQAPAGQRGEYFLLRSQLAEYLKGKFIEHSPDWSIQREIMH